MVKKKMLYLGLVLGMLIAVSSLAGCAPAGEGEGGGSILPMIIFLVVLFGLMYLVMIKPQRKRQQQHQQLIEELKRGDKVMTAGGVYGVIESISEDNVVIKVESGMTMRVAKGSVVGKREQ